jgi:hypothetical protein
MQFQRKVPSLNGFVTLSLLIFYGFIYSPDRAECVESESPSVGLSDSMLPFTNILILLFRCDMDAAQGAAFSYDVASSRRI